MMEFYKSYENIDIWRDLDTKSGNEIFEFYFQGKTYTAYSGQEAIALAAQILTEKKKAQNTKVGIGKFR